MSRKLLETDQSTVASISAAFNELREPTNEWQRLIKGVLKNLMDDFIRLQHPSARDEQGCKEAFQMSLAALYDIDYRISWPGPEGTDLELSFRELLAQRFGLDNIDRREIQRINIDPLRKELIQEALAYWKNRKTSIVDPPDFISYKGESYSVWPVSGAKDDTSIDTEACIAYVLTDKDKPRGPKFQHEFLRATFMLVNEKEDLSLTEDQIEELSKAYYEILRMNGCFRQGG
jgi:hypothetical protein